MGYIVLVCPKCHNVFITTSKNQYRRPKKYATCPSCGKRVKISPNHIVYGNIQTALKVRNKLLLRI